MMYGGHGRSAVATGPTGTCPLCGKPVGPDQLGFIECVCGWGGKDDPLALSRGLTRWWMRIDRRVATAQAQRDLARLAALQTSSIAPGVAYQLLLIVAATVVYLVLFGLAVGGAYLTLSLAHDQAWIGVALTGAGTLIIVLALLHPHRHPRGIEAPVIKYPLLAQALTDVGKRLDVPPPTRVLFMPGTGIHLFLRHPLRRAFRRELVVVIGVSGLALLSEVELRVLLAQQLAYYRHGDTLLHNYLTGAGGALRYLIDLVQAEVDTQVNGLRRAARRLRYGGYNTGVSYVTVLVMWTVLLPFRIFWTCYHWLSLRESRSAVFDADRAAVGAYGVDAFVHGLANLHVVQRTLRGSLTGIRQEMAKHNEQNFYAELRRHYQGLPESVLEELRRSAIVEFRSLERTHPITPDRIRAALLVPVATRPDPASASASSLLTPAGADDAQALEVELTGRLFK